MGKRRRTWLLMLAMTGVALAVYFEPSHCVRGWLWGEAFYDGWPTSSWRRVVEHDLRFGLKPEPLPASSAQIWWARCKDWVGYRPTITSAIPLLHDDESARAVLRQLQDDTNQDVAAFAKDALQWKRRVTMNTDDGAWAYWLVLIRTHQLRNE